MTQYVYTLLETTGTQAYIFASNDLRENIGGSQLVYAATHDYAFETLDAVTNSSHNIDLETFSICQEKHIENGNLLAEVVFAGGGGLAVLFAGADPLPLAKDFVYQHSLSLLTKAPNLQLTAAHVTFDPAKETLFTIEKQAHAKLQQSPLTNTPQLGLSVTLPDSATGLPTTSRLSYENAEEADFYLASAERAKKRDIAVRDAAELRLDRTLDDTWGLITENYNGQIPRDFDDLNPEAGEDRYIAVIHIDGNGMGKRINAWKTHHEHAGLRMYIEKLREFSQAITDSSASALANALAPWASRQYANCKYFPVRPIVFGGDDITLVSHAKLGLRIAANYLEHIGESELPDGARASASAGVSIVKVRYPFTRAYQLSEDLRASARDYAKSLGDAVPSCSIDWHISQGGTLGGIKDIRDREYQATRKSAQDQLVMRPLLVGDDDEAFRDWTTFEYIVRQFSSSYWETRRNKRAELRDILRQDEASLANFMSTGVIVRGKRQRMDMPTVADYDPNFAKHGWGDGICYFYDALEALDFVELEVSQ